MTSIPTITESHILEKVTEKSFERGMDYYHSGMVESVVQRGDRLFADVLGSEWDPYQVGIALRDGDFRASCTCPYDWGGYCKHVVAVMLTFVHDKGLIASRQPIEELLSKLHAGELRGIILRMIESDPRLADVVDSFCSQAVSQ